MNARMTGLVAAMAVLASGVAWSQVPAGPPFQVNTFTTGRQSYPHLAVKANGEFVVVWDHVAEYGTTPSDDTAASAEFRKHLARVLTKPVDPATLAAEILQVLGRQSV